MKENIRKDCVIVLCFKNSRYLCDFSLTVKYNSPVIQLDIFMNTWCVKLTIHWWQENIKVAHLIDACWGPVDGCHYCYTIMNIMQKQIMLDMEISPIKTQVKIITTLVPPISSNTIFATLLIYGNHWEERYLTADILWCTVELLFVEVSLYLEIVTPSLRAGHGLWSTAAMWGSLSEKRIISYTEDGKQPEYERFSNISSWKSKYSKESAMYNP